MNRKILLPVLLSAIAVLPGCAKETSAVGGQPSQKNSASPSAESLRIFKDPGAHPAAELMEAGSAMLKAGTTLPASSAEACLDHPKLNPEVKDLCALLWAGGSDRNEILERYIIDASASSEMAAIAITLRKELLRGLPAVSMVAALKSLRRQPLWIRSALANDWLNAGGTLGESDRSETLRALKLSGPLSPASIGTALVALKKIDEPSFQAAAANYCHRDYQGALVIRCWRVLSATAQIPDGDSVRTSLIPRLPTADANAYSLYQKGFGFLAKISTLLPY